MVSQPSSRSTSSLAIDQLEKDRMHKNLVAQQYITINAPTSKVWEALTNPGLIKQYLFGSDVVSDWREGSPIIYEGTYQGKAFQDKGVVLKTEPEKLLILSHWSPLSGLPDSPENYHTVSYKLTAENDGTQVNITQDNNSNEDEQRANEQFWGTVLGGLKKVLEQ